MHKKVKKFIIISYTILEKFKKLKISTHLCLVINQNWKLFFTITSSQKDPKLLISDPEHWFIALVFYHFVQSNCWFSIMIVFINKETWSKLSLFSYTDIKLWLKDNQVVSRYLSFCLHTSSKPNLSKYASIEPNVLRIYSIVAIITSGLALRNVSGSTSTFNPHLKCF